MVRISATAILALIFAGKRQRAKRVVVWICGASAQRCRNNQVAERRKEVHLD